MTELAASTVRSLKDLVRFLGTLTSQMPPATNSELAQQALDYRNHTFRVVLRSIDKSVLLSTDTWTDKNKQKRECARLATEHKLYVMPLRGDETAPRRLDTASVINVAYAIVKRDRPGGAENKASHLYRLGSAFLCPYKLRKAGYHREREVCIVTLLH